jgi:hypothetical protein
MVDLTERQQQLFFLLLSAVADHRPDGPVALADADVAEAAAAAAATIETANRGVIYEHKPQSILAHKLAVELSGLPQMLREQGATVHDREVVAALRAIERGARPAAERGGSGNRAYLTLVGRLIVPAGRRARPPVAGEADASAEPRSPLILP